MDMEHQIDKGFIVLASIVKSNFVVHLNIFCRCNKQALFSGQKYSRYRSLTINNVFFEQNKMAEEGIRNTTTGVSVGVSCFYSH